MKKLTEELRKRGYRYYPEKECIRLWNDDCDYIRISKMDGEGYYVRHNGDILEQQSITDILNVLNNDLHIVPQKPTPFYQSKKFQSQLFDIGCFVLVAGIGYLTGYADAFNHGVKVHITYDR